MKALLILLVAVAVAHDPTPPGDDDDSAVGDDDDSAGDDDVVDLVDVAAAWQQTWDTVAFDERALAACFSDPTAVVLLVGVDEDGRSRGSEAVSTDRTEVTLTPACEAILAGFDLGAAPAGGANRFGFRFLERSGRLRLVPETRLDTRPGRPAPAEPGLRVVAAQAEGSTWSRAGELEAAVAARGLRIALEDRGCELERGAVLSVRATFFEGDPLLEHEATSCLDLAAASLRVPAAWRDTTLQLALFTTREEGPSPNTDKIILGSLSKDHIDSVVKKNLRGISGCYQRSLNRDPGLRGKLVVKFVIAQDGSVSSASTKSSTLRNRTVEECVNAEFRMMRFHRPKGGGIVIVSYPFVFNSK